MNKVENYKFKYTYVNIDYQSNKFSISVFDKPRELKEKIAEISGCKYLNSPAYVIQLKDKESYIYGDELLIDFESVYNTLIKGKTLKLITKRKNPNEDKENNIKFWVKSGRKKFIKEQEDKFQRPAKYSEPKHIFDHKEKVEINIASFRNLHSILELLEKNMKDK